MNFPHLSSNLKSTFIILIIATIFISCNSKVKHQERPTILVKTAPVLEQTSTIEDFNANRTTKQYLTELNEVLSDPTIDEYYKKIFKQEKLIWVEDEKMLTIIDSLSTKNKTRELFYFIVFTKTMNGADGFYSEPLGEKALWYIINREQHFADYFAKIPKLTRKDLNNWSSNILGEIKITRENEEQKALTELEEKLVSNLKITNFKVKEPIIKLIDLIKKHLNQSVHN